MQHRLGCDKLCEIIRVLISRKAIAGKLELPPRRNINEHWLLNKMVLNYVGLVVA